MAVVVPHSFGRYRVTGTLGAGAMGEVYAAVDEVLGREVAVKTLRSGTPGGGLGARIVDERFRQEARAIAALAHPGIVQVYDIDLAAEPPYLVMERVAGPTLKGKLGSGPLSAHELRALGIQLGRALAAAHAAGIVHRDVKPANILAAGEGAWKLADFGVAHVPDSSITMTGQFVGSPAYAPPEALLRGQCTTAGDVYGLGASLYEAAAGRWPRMESTTGALFAPVQSLAELAPSLPPEITSAIDRAVSVEPADRPSAAELADALAGAASTPGAHAVAPAATAATAATAAKRWWWLIAGLVAMVGIAIATRGSSSPTSAQPALSSPQLPSAAPAMPDDKAAKDWNKLVDKINDQEYREALDRLDDWETRYGATEETQALRPQLEAAAAQSQGNYGGGRGRGHGKRGKHQD